MGSVLPPPSGQGHVFGTPGLPRGKNTKLSTMPRYTQVKRKGNGQEMVVFKKQATGSSPSSSTAGARALRLVRQLRPELHAISNFNTVQTIYGGTTATSQSIALMNSVGQGADTNTRIGRKIRHMSCQVRICITGYTTATLADSGFWALILDRQPNGALAAFTDMYDTTLGLSGIAPRTILTSQERFKVLATEQWTASAASQGGSAYICNKYIDMSKLKGQDGIATFSSGSTGIAAFNSGALLLVYAQNALNGIATPTSYNSSVVYKFTDV